MADKSRDTISSYLMAIIFAGIVVVFADINGYLNPFHDFVSQAVVPIELNLREFGSGVTAVGSSLTSWLSLKEANVKCTNELSASEAELALLSDVMEENAELKSQLGAFSSGLVSTVQARIVRYGANVLGKELKLDKGTVDGISNGDVVVYGNNLVGYVRDADSYTSYVELINSSNSSIYAEVQRSRDVGIVQGSKDGIFIEELLPSDSIEVGDVIIVWDEVLSVTLIVGEVVAVDDNPAATTKAAEVKQYITVDNLEYVYIISRR